jgi:serine/threonine-protein kinase ULK4
MAPELFQDEGVYSFASDFWALGCVLYELATGKPPFTSSSFQELVNMIISVLYAYNPLNFIERSSKS